MSYILDAADSAVRGVICVTTRTIYLSKFPFMGVIMPPGRKLRHAFVVRGSLLTVDVVGLLPGTPYSNNTHICDNRSSYGKTYSRTVDQPVP